MTQDELFEHMREWNAFVRRHNANIFDVMFKDVEYSLSDDELCSIISDIALFFGLFRFARFRVNVLTMILTAHSAEHI